jgi:hypothetical protein
MKIELDILELNEIIYAMGVAKRNGLLLNDSLNESVTEKLNNHLNDFCNEYDKTVREYWEVRDRIEANISSQN